MDRVRNLLDAAKRCYNRGLFPMGNMYQKKARELMHGKPKYYTEVTKWRRKNLFS